MEFKHTKLDNGLSIVAEVNPAAQSQAVGFFVRTGSRDETPALAGVSHFLEHMMFKGSDRRSWADINREFDEIGAVYNASTSYEETIYFAAVLPEFQSRMLGVLCDLLRPAFRAEEFELEKKVILEEIAMVHDLPQHRLMEGLMALHFEGHPLAHSVIGTPESIQPLQRESMRAYFQQRYAPGNMTLVGVGNLDYEALVRQVAELCAAWQAFPVGRDTPPATPSPRQKLLPDQRLAREHIGLMSPAPSHQDPDRYAAALLATILGDTTGSRLYYALVDPALADEASSTYEPMDRAGAFLTVLSTAPERAAEALDIARREIRKLRDEGPTEKEIEAAKNKIASGATLRGEIPMGRLSAVGFDWVYRGEYVPLARQIELMLALTRDDLVRVARQHDLSAVSSLALGPVESL